MTLATPGFLRHRLKTRHLLLLVTLADEGNIHRSAEVLAMTQPGASKLLREMEQLLGVPLFERLPRGVRPTPYGEALIRHARQVVDSLDKAQEEIAGLRDGHAGQIRVGSITSPAVNLLPDAVAQVKRDLPQLHVTVEIENSNVLLERLAQDRLDLVIGRLSVEHDQMGMSYEPLAFEPVNAVTRPGHPLLARTDLTLHDLSQAEWIVTPTGSVLRHRFDLMFQRASLAPPTRLIETSAPLFTLRLLERSDMVAALTADVAGYCAERGLVGIVPLEMPCHMDDYGIITRTDRLLSPATQHLYDTLRRFGLSLDKAVGRPG